MVTFAVVLLSLLTLTNAADSNDQCTQPEGSQGCGRKSVGNMLIQVTKRENRDKDAPGYTYSLGEAGTGDCPEGTERVLDQTECKEYAEKRDWAYAGANCYQMTEGCLNNTGNIYFSTCNYTTIDPYHSAVCKKMAVAETNTTPIAVDTHNTSGNTTADADIVEVTNATSQSNASNTTENVTTEVVATSSNDTAASNQTNQTEAPELEVETLTLKLNWHRRRTDFNRRRHQACDNVGEGFTCPNFASQDNLNFSASQNGSRLCIESDPDDHWDFDVVINCTKGVEAERETNSTVESSPATDQLFNVLDQDHDGSVSKEEFVGSFHS